MYAKRKTPFYWRARTPEETRASITPRYIPIRPDLPHVPLPRDLPLPRAVPPLLPPKEAPQELPVARQQQSNLGQKKPAARHSQKRKVAARPANRPSYVSILPDLPHIHDLPLPRVPPLPPTEARQELPVVAHQSNMGQKKPTARRHKKRKVAATRSNRPSNKRERKVVVPFRFLNPKNEVDASGDEALSQILFAATENRPKPKNNMGFFWDTLLRSKPVTVEKTAKNPVNQKSDSKVSSSETSAKNRKKPRNMGFFWDALLSSKPVTVDKATAKAKKRQADKNHDKPTSSSSSDPSPSSNLDCLARTVDILINESNHSAKRQKIGKSLMHEASSAVWSNFGRPEDMARSVSFTSAEDKLSNESDRSSSVMRQKSEQEKCPEKSSPTGSASKSCQSEDQPGNVNSSSNDDLPDSEPNPLAKRQKREQENWNVRYQDMVEFKEKHGHTKVPLDFETDEGVALGLWAATQRRENSRREKGEPNNMYPDRLEKLKEIEFEWARRSGPSNDQWEAHFQALVEFKEQNGHIRVPRSVVSSQAFRLGAWVERQRTACRKKPARWPNSLFQERTRRLAEIGLEWDLGRERGPRGNDLWEAKYQALVEFKKKHGHARIPWDFVTKDGLKVGLWASTQREQYRKRNRGLSHRLYPERFQKLEEIRFDWSPMNSRRGISKAESEDVPETKADDDSEIITEDDKVAEV